VYNELPDDARYELEQHLTQLPLIVRAELKATSQFYATLSKHRLKSPRQCAYVLANALQEALETAEGRVAGGKTIHFEPAAWLRQIQFSPRLAAVIIHHWFCREASGHIQE